MFVYFNGFLSPGSLFVALGLKPLTAAIETFTAAETLDVVLFDGVIEGDCASGPKKFGNSSAKAVRSSWRRNMLLNSGLANICAAVIILLLRVRLEYEQHDYGKQSYTMTIFSGCVLNASSSGVNWFVAHDSLAFVSWKRLFCLINF